MSLALKQDGFTSIAVNASGEYTLAQCMGYLNESECSDCLTNISQQDFCNGSLSKQVHLASYYYHYELYTFFEAPPSLDPPAPASLALPPSTKSFDFTSLLSSLAFGCSTTIVFCLWDR
ncbi:hypothetical protein GOP47_0020446 [Adiantum capillus-veneris]|uniref:Gnk2-homologous domain-containing protein n=1 Tax=Adiantum capillus-veneris TaxID=13818 RepID=A0A9D4Z8P8_ADICA|nr:hypothetical protein GOP47_0020446 [Adiantum capillus-veneris]